jgi:hypothetical protein
MALLRFVKVISYLNVDNVVYFSFCKDLIFRSYLQNKIKNALCEDNPHPSICDLMSVTKLDVEFSYNSV